MSEYYAVVREGESLQHFGVLGMRWGIRHDRRVKAAKATYRTNRRAINKNKSLSKEQKQKKIAASREEWMKERENAANRLYSLNGKAMNKKIARQSSGKTLAKSMLMGSAGAAAYDKMRVSGGGRLGSAVKGSVVGGLDSTLYGLPSLGYYAANVARRPDVQQARRKKRR